MPPHASTSKPKPSIPQIKAAPMGLHLAVLGIFYASLVAFALHVFYGTPPPVPASAGASLFSEERARSHVAVLSEEIGVRSVSTPGLQAAHRYIWDFTQQLQAAAEARGDILVQATFENYTSATDFDFVGERFINAFHNISNIILHVSKKGQEHMPAVLLVAHHDSPVASAGAGDDASNVGVMLELASNLVASPVEDLPAGPIMFLFSGAEEPLCQSAAAFMAASPWASRVGCFINLESIGPGGAPIVFQHAGAWTIEAFAKGAIHPRGAIAAQDIFDAGLVLGDTDYRQLSYRDRGKLPGIDIAYLLSGAAYHTDRDTLDAIRPGVLQETGQTLTGAIRSLSEVLAAATAKTLEAGASDAASEQLMQLLQPTDHRRMFMSVAGVTMITYSSKMAALLHNVPLVMTLTAPLTLQLLAPDSALPVSQGFVAMAGGAARSLATFVAALAAPAGIGALRAWLTGRAMVWFAQQAAAFGIYVPVAVAVLLLPWSHMDYSKAPDKQLLPYHMLGAALLNSLAAAGLTQLGAGIGMIFALWGGCGALAAFCLSQGVTLPAMLAALLSVTWPIYACCETALVLSIVMMSRMSLTGHVFIGLGDAIVGLLLGLGVVSITGLTLVPMVQALLGTRSRRLAGGLLLSALLVTAGSSRMWPYSESMPKRLMLANLHYTEALQPAHGTADAGSQVPDTAPQMRIANSSWVLGGSDSNPIGWIARAMGFNLQDTQELTGNELNLIYPVSKLLDTLKFPAAVPDEPMGELPYVRLLSQRSIKPADQHSTAAGEEGQGVAWTEVELEVVVAKPCWGTMNLSGVDIASWSITPGQWQDAATFMSKRHSGSGGALSGQSRLGSEAWGQDTIRSLVVKFTNEHWQGPMRWKLTLRLLPQHQGKQQECEGPSGLEVELHVGLLEKTPQLAAMLERMPSWSTISYLATVVVSKWRF